MRQTQSFIKLGSRQINMTIGWTVHELTFASQRYVAAPPVPTPPSYTESVNESLQNLPNSHSVFTLDTLPDRLRGGAVAIGNFDGVHRGHAWIVERLLARARAIDGPAIAFTFDPHPLALLRPASLQPLLTQTARKAELLMAIGVDGIVVAHTSRELLNLEPAEFFQQVIQQRLGAKALVEGPNFYFGKNRAGDLSLLQRLCDASAMKLEVVAPLVIDDQIVSSSRVRNLVIAGKVGAANLLLTRPFRLNGRVSYGAQRGRTIGFPTANLEQVATVLPGPGVYVARTTIDDVTYAAAVNVGPNPTFGDQAMKIEVHVIDYAGDLYGRELNVDFLDRLRDVQSFASVAELKAQLRFDVAEAREYCACAGK